MPTFVLIGMCVASVIAVAPSAYAEGRFDGNWIVSLVTHSGSCPPKMDGEVQVTNGIIRSPNLNEGVFSGSVSANGQVVAKGSLGALTAMAIGRASTDSSANGTWRARVAEGPCAGVWTARRK